jgi:hypothetical protein
MEDIGRLLFGILSVAITVFMFGLPVLAVLVLIVLFRKGKR